MPATFSDIQSAIRQQVCRYLRSTKRDLIIRLAMLHIHGRFDFRQIESPVHTTQFQILCDPKTIIPHRISYIVSQ